MRYSLAIILLFSLLTSACKKDGGNNISSPVNVYIYLDQPDNINLSVPGNWIYYPGGNRGIIVYRRNQSEFAAYERACTYDPTAPAALLRVDSSNVSMRDSLCGSRFSIYDGSVINGPAGRPAFQYHTEISQGNVLHIYN